MINDMPEKPLFEKEVFNFDVKDRTMNSKEIYDQVVKREQDRLTGIIAGYLNEETNKEYMKATIGRIVIYKDEFGVEHPAVIHKVWSDTLVNLNYFTDQGAKVKTSVIKGGGFDNWSWPVIEPQVLKPDGN